MMGDLEGSGEGCNGVRDIGKIHEKKALGEKKCMDSQNESEILK